MPNGFSEFEAPEWLTLLGETLGSVQLGRPDIHGRRHGPRPFEALGAVGRLLGQSRTRRQQEEAQAAFTKLLSESLGVRRTVSLGGPLAAEAPIREQTITGPPTEANAAAMLGHAQAPLAERGPLTFERPVSRSEFAKRFSSLPAAQQRLLFPEFKGFFGKFPETDVSDEDLRDLYQSYREMGLPEPLAREIVAETVAGKQASPLATGMAQGTVASRLEKAFPQHRVTVGPEGKVALATERGTQEHIPTYGVDTERTTQNLFGGKGGYPSIVRYAQLKPEHRNIVDQTVEQHRVRLKKEEREATLEAQTATKSQEPPPPDVTYLDSNGNQVHPPTRAETRGLIALKGPPQKEHTAEETAITHINLELDALSNIGERMGTTGSRPEQWLKLHVKQIMNDADIVAWEQTLGAFSSTAMAQVATGGLSAGGRAWNTLQMMRTSLPNVSGDNMTTSLQKLDTLANRVDRDLQSLGLPRNKATALKERIRSLRIRFGILKGTYDRKTGQINPAQP